MPQNDDWLEDLYADGANDQPPSDLDAKILTAAAQVSQAVHVPTRQRGSRRYVGWAAAALVLLTGATAAELGGGRWAQLVAAASVSISGTVLVISGFYSMNCL